MTKEYLLSEDKLWDKIFEDFKDKGGAYKLICKENDTIKSIGRFIKTDLNGILYIGKANSYLDRVIGLKKTIDPKMKSEPHICGRRYNKNKRIGKQFPYKNLFIQLIGDSNPEQKEKEELDKYFEEFGEVPPLNANG